MGGGYKLVSVGTLRRDSNERIVFEPSCEFHVKDGMPVYSDDNVAPLQAEIERLRHRNGIFGLELTNEVERRIKAEKERDQLKARSAELESALKFYADREHYHFESGNWDTVSGEPLNILWCGDEPDFIEDGSVARSALSKPAEGEQA